MKIRKIQIPAAELIETYTVYYIEVFIKEYSWLVRRRYSEFRELHEKLVRNHNVESNLLPPKKFFGKLNPDYVEKRREGLEKYLQSVLEGFDEALPVVLQQFLEADRYDVCGVTYSLAKELFQTGDTILSKGEVFTLTPLQLHCITARLAVAAPTCDVRIPHGEIGNLYDFLYQLKHLRISGRKKQVELSENVTLKCDLSIFKGLQTFQMYRCDVESFCGLSSMMDQLTKITVHHSLHLLKDILVDDEMWEKGVLESVEQNGTSSLSTSDIGTYNSWSMVVEADFSKNELSYIDESVDLLPNVEVLNLSHNCIQRVEHLQALSNLVELDLSHNNITVLGDNLNAKLGNVKTLKLAGNSIENTDGLEKMYSLVYLDLASNKLTEADPVLSLGELPCLEYLDLRHNPVTKETMYRVRVFIAFDERAAQVCLDGFRPSKREMTRVKELLEAEQTFEVINYPEFPRQVASNKARQGIKKMKNKDRVIALGGGGMEDSTTSTSDTTSLLDECDAEFRTKVEKIRQMGGDAWLTMLGEMQNVDAVSLRDSNRADSITTDLKEEEISKKAVVRPFVKDTDKLDRNKSDSVSLTSVESETLIAKASSVHLEDSGTAPPRLLFGFSQQLEELVHEKLESSKDVISGTFMVEVEGKTAGQVEERMVGIDLSKGVIMEIQLATGKTCAKHKLEDVSSVDILEVESVYYVDIRDMYSKEWRRHRTVLASGHGESLKKDYKQVARYCMRSISDAAELFVLLYLFITKSWERSTGHIAPKLTVEESGPQSGPFMDQTVEWSNPVGVPAELLHSYFVNFISGDLGPGRERSGARIRSGSEHDGKERIRAKNIQAIYQSLHTEFIEAGALRHDRSDRLGEVVRLVLWAGCLPYTYPEHELPVCLLMTNVNIYLFHLYNQDSGPTHVSMLRTARDLQGVLHCFYSFPVRALNQVVIGLYDQGFRLEVKLDGPKGTFTFLTRDAEKTGKFLEVLCDVLGEPLTSGHAPLARRVSQLSTSGDKPSFVYHDEEKLSSLKDKLFKGISTEPDNQNLLMYSIVRELTDINDAHGHFHEIEVLTKSLRSLIVTSSRIFLCDEDHVHWPLPTFMRAQPSTPQWVVTKSQELNRIIGVDVFELDTMSDLVGGYGLSLIFDSDESDEVESDRPVAKSNCWKLMFRAVDEREQLQRSLAQVWKDNFQADLFVTHTKTKLRPCGPEDRPTDLLNVSDTPSKLLTPVGTPNEKQFKKSHRRVGSDNVFPTFKTRVPDSLESLVSLDRKALNTFFRKAIAEREKEEEPESLLHVLWTGCTPYLFPLSEIQVCLLVSNLNIYILADGKHKKLINKRKGIKLPSGDGGKDSKTHICFNIIPLWKLRQVSVGLFDQTFRLETEQQEDTFTVITRDFNLTSSFLECLNAILASKKHGDFTESSLREDELHNSIYDSQSCHLEGKDDSAKSEFYHADSGVKFVYPSDDTLEILKDTIAKYSQDSDDCTSIRDVTILVYLLVFHMSAPEREEPRTLIIMDKALCLCLEDHVNYPLTLFATGLPATPRYQVQDLRDIATLTRVEFSGFNSCDFSLVFSPWSSGHESEDFDSASMGELCVITHHKAILGEVEESKWRVMAQTYEEKEKALTLICKLWSDIKGGALPVMKVKEAEE